MPRRSIRVAAAAFCLASLLLCFGVAWMSRGAGRRVGVYTPFGRWSVLAAGGRVTLFRPLPCCPPSRLAWVRQRVEAAGSLRNEDVRWLVGSVRQDKWVESPNALPFGTGSAVTPFADTSLGAEVNRPLLEALEDPAAFAAAHVALSLHLDRVTDTWDVQGSGRSVVANFNRLPVELKPDADAGIPPDRMVYRDAAAAPVDPAQLPAIRDYWHARTSRPVASLPRGLLLAATAAPPLLWLLPRAARAGGRVRRRLGRPELGTPRQQVGRWLFVAAAAFSELVLVAVVALWVRSWRVADWWTASHESSAGLTCLASERGKLLVFRQRSRREDTGPVTWTFESGGFRGFTLPPDAKGAGIAGLRLATWVVQGDGARIRVIVVPYWMPALALLVLPAAWVRVSPRWWRVARWRRAGRCQACGYSLRASPVRCPECGRETGRPLPPKLGRAARLALLAALLSAAGAAALAVWSNPARGATPGPGAAPDDGIDFYPPWEAAWGDAADRMLRRDESWGRQWYQSIWHSPDGDLLVVVTPTNVHVYNDIWRVRVLDRSLRIVREGNAWLPTDQVPWRLAELSTYDPDVPPEYRGRWLLGVRCRPSPEAAAGVGGAGYVNVVHWDGSTIPERDWENVGGVAVRSAEPER